MQAVFIAQYSANHAVSRLVFHYFQRWYHVSFTLLCDPVCILAIQRTIGVHFCGNEFGLNTVFLIVQLMHSFGDTCERYNFSKDGTILWAFCTYTGNQLKSPLPPPGYFAHLHFSEGLK